MKAKDFFAKMEDVALAIASGVMFILFCNPLSLFVFNLFFPENAARFVREFIGFNDRWRSFYTKSALKWPFWWSRWWITLDNLKTVSVRKQIAYYLTNLNRSAVLEAMSSEAQVALVRKRLDRMNEIYGIMRLTDEMFEEWLRQLIAKGRRTKHLNIEGWQKLFAPLCNFLKRGKLPFSQVMILTRAAVDEYNNSARPLMWYLNDYIERYGLSKKQLEEIAQYMSENIYWHDIFGEEPTTESEKIYEQHKKFKHFYDIVNERQINYEQRVFTRSQRGKLRTDEWRNFCEKTAYICVAAQKEMDIEQYRIFHSTGHSLRSEAIIYFLEYPDRNLHRLIFKYEPLEVFAEDELNTFIDKHDFFRALLNEEMAHRKSELA